MGLRSTILPLTIVSHLFLMQTMYVYIKMMTSLKYFIHPSVCFGNVNVVDLVIHILVDMNILPNMHIIMIVHGLNFNLERIQSNG